MECDWEYPVFSTEYQWFLIIWSWHSQHVASSLVCVLWYSQKFGFTYSFSIGLSILLLSWYPNYAKSVLLISNDYLRKLFRNHLNIFLIMHVFLLVKIGPTIIKKSLKVTPDKNSDELFCGRASKSSHTGATRGEFKAPKLLETPCLHCSSQLMKFHL